MTQIPHFSGTDPAPKDEASFDQWIFQVNGACKSHRPEAIRSCIVYPVRGGAREFVGFVGFDTSLDIIITKMEERYHKNWSTDRLQQEFCQLQQEKIHQFVAWLKQKVRKLHAKFPDRYENRQLQDGLFHGMLQNLRDSMRFLYK